MYRIISYGHPFDRKQFLMNIGSYIEKGYGSYNEILQMSIRDILEIKVGIVSKEQEEELSKALGG